MLACKRSRPRRDPKTSLSSKHSLARFKFRPRASQLPSAKNWASSQKTTNGLGPCNSLFQINFFRIATKVKDLQRKSHAISDDYYAIAAEIKHLSELLAPADIPQFCQFYERLSQQVV